MPLTPANKRPTPKTSANEPCIVVAGANSFSRKGLSFL